MSSDVKTILPVTYLGNVQWFAHLLGDECVVDVGEYYLKQSYRNRCTILSANGVMSLSVQVVKSNRPHVPVRDVRIDYSKRWQHQHWVSIVSAYKSSPYFDFYGEAFEPFYQRRYDFLVDYDLDLCRTVMQVLGMPDVLRIVDSRDGLPDGPYNDLRGNFSPKPRLAREDSRFAARPYCQVFADRMPFAANLSILDLIFCEGPESLSILKSCLL